MSKTKTDELNIKLLLCLDKLLDKLDIDISDFVGTPDDLRGAAPCHGGNNNTAFWLNTIDGKWACWTKGCHEEYGSDLIGLYRAVTGSKFKDIIEELTKMTDGVDIDKEQIQDIIKNKLKRKQKLKVDYWEQHRNPIKTYDESCLDNLESADFFCERRSFCPKIFKEHGIGYAIKGKMWDRIVVPVRNIYGKIVGFSGRKVHYKEETDIKWFHYKKGEFKRNVNFFNINNAFKEANGKYFLVEGPFDVIRLQSVGIKNAIAIFGRSISVGQIEILKHIGATNLIIAFDADEAGEEGAEASKIKLEKNSFEVGILNLNYHYPDWDEEKFGGLDWGNGNLSKEQILRIVK